MGICTCLPENPGGKEPVSLLVAGKSWELARVCQKNLAGKKTGFTLSGRKSWELVRVCQKIMAGKNWFHSKWREKVGNLHTSAKKSWRERTGFTLSGGKKREAGTCLPENLGMKEPASQ